jgi:hypothetical protein
VWRKEQEKVTEKKADFLTHESANDPSTAHHHGFIFMMLIGNDAA